MLRFLGLAVAALGLSACVEATGEIVAVEGRHEALAPRGGAAVEKATVAFVGFDGAPGAAGDSFMASLRADLAARQVVVADAKSARYLVKTYVSAERTEGGAQYAYAFDVFAADKHRARRLDDAVARAGGDDDLWGPHGEDPLRQLAQRGADDLYAFLSNTPEAAKISGPAKAATLVSQN